jgi:hypothetical protein
MLISLKNCLYIGLNPMLIIFYHVNKPKLRANYHTILFENGNYIYLRQ